MKKLFFAFVLMATPVLAADAPKQIPLSATPEELQALDGLLGLATKAGPVDWNVTNNALAWHTKLVQAVADANKPAVAPDASAPATIPH